MARATTEPKTHPPSKRRLLEARRRGEIAQSARFSAALVMAGVLLTLTLTVPSLVGVVDSTLRDAIEMTRTPPDVQALIAWTVDTFSLVAQVLWPLLGVAFVLAIAAPMSQFGVVFTLKPLAFDGAKVNPFVGLGERVFRKDRVVDLVLALLALAVVGVALVIVLRGHVRDTVELVHATPTQAAEFVGAVLLHVSMVAVGLLLGLGVLDVVVQRGRLMSKLRMTRREIEDERRQEQVDPRVRARQREARRITLQDEPMRALREADVLVWCGGALECVAALRFDPSRESCPRVLAVTQGALVQAWREQARVLRVPSVKDARLAKLACTVQPGALLPEAGHADAAAVLRWVGLVQRGRGRVPAWEMR